MSQEQRTLVRLAVWIFVTALLAGVSGGPAGAEELPAEPPWATPAPPGELDPDILGRPVRMDKCGFCDTTPFNPTPTVLCTFAGTCQPGANGCCDYVCQCGGDSGNTTIPSNACSLDLTWGCDTAPFNPRFGVVCTFDCFDGSGSCCEYSCRCGQNTGNTSTPAGACSLDLPQGCCAGGLPLCLASYCDDEGVRCVASGCEVGCCSYACGPDPTCTGPDPVPPGAC